MKLEILLKANGPNVIKLNGEDISQRVLRKDIAITPIQGGGAVVNLPLRISELWVTAEDAKPTVTITVDAAADPAAIGREIKRALAERT